MSLQDATQLFFLSAASQHCPIAWETKAILAFILTFPMENKENNQSWADQLSSYLPWRRKGERAVQKQRVLLPKEVVVVVGFFPPVGSMKERVKRGEHISALLPLLCYNLHLLNGVQSLSLRCVGLIFNKPLVCHLRQLMSLFNFFPCKTL